MKDFDAEPQATEGGRRVVLLAGSGPLFDLLALALAARGDSIILWEDPGSSGIEGSDAEMNAVRNSECRPPHSPDPQSAICNLQSSIPPSAFPTSTLDLQLAIARAGGISLRVRGGELGVAAESFGRIDAAVALTREAARQMLAAAASLERRLRPARLIVPQEGDSAEKSAPLPVALNADSARAALGVEISPGIRICIIDLSSGLETSDPAAVVITRILSYS